MSMREYPLHLPACLLITPDIVPHIVLHYDKLHNNVPENLQRFVDDPDGFAEAVAQNDPDLDEEGYFDVSFVQEIMDSFDIEHVHASEFCGCAQRLNKDLELPDINFDCDTVVCIPAQKDPDLFSAVYPSFDHLVDEFRTAAVSILPPGFDIEAYICKVVGTYFC